MELDAPTAILPFEPAHLPLVRRFSEVYWDRPRDDRFYEWRYVECRDFSRMFLAVQADECPGMVFALQKKYVVAGARADCLDLCDWHTLPGLKGSGIGIRLMRKMMRQPERLFAIGGTADVHKALPAMGWQRLASAKAYELRSSGDALAESLHARTGVPRWLTAAPLGPVAWTWLRPKSRQRPAGGTIDVAARPQPEIQTLYSGPTAYGVVQVPDERVLDWTARTPPANGVFTYLLFRVGGQLRGWALTRSYDAKDGREGAIVDLFAPQPDVPLYTWMVSEAAVSLLSAKPRLMRARASCPILQAALEANAFRASPIDVPIFTWPKNLTGSDPFHCTLNHTDEPLRPYRTAATS